MLGLTKLLIRPNGPLDSGQIWAIDEDEALRVTGQTAADWEQRFKQHSCRCRSRDGLRPRQQKNLKMLAPPCEGESRQQFKGWSCGHLRVSNGPIWVRCRHFVRRIPQAASPRKV